ncbi:MAG: DDE-type integrase/transposase/recombinase [Pontixanthobacter sp.]
MTDGDWQRYWLRNVRTDFTYLKIIGWGWYYLSTILDDYSRYDIAWKLCTTMRAEDVTDTMSWLLRRQAATKRMCCTNRACCGTVINFVFGRANWPTILLIVK